MTYKRFEELPAWQTARKLERAIYAESGKGRFAFDRILQNQMQRAAISMMANIAEGFSRRSDREFVQYLFTAKASAAELQSHLYVALDQAYLDEKTFNHFFRVTEHFARQVSGLISYLTGHSRSHRVEKPGPLR